MYLIGLIATLVGLVGMIWIAITAFREGDTIWGIGSIVFGGIVAPIYGFMNFEICRVPAIMCAVGFGGRIMIRMVSES